LVGIKKKKLHRSTKMKGRLLFSWGKAGGWLFLPPVPGRVSYSPPLLQKKKGRRAPPRGEKKKPPFRRRVPCRPQILFRREEKGKASLRSQIRLNNKKKGGWSTLRGEASSGRSDGTRKGRGSPFSRTKGDFTLYACRPWRLRRGAFYHRRKEN